MNGKEKKKKKEKERKKITVLSNAIRERAFKSNVVIQRMLFK